MASDALSSTGTSPQTALRRKYEALSGRTPSAAETEVLAQLCNLALVQTKPASGKASSAKAPTSGPATSKASARTTRKRASQPTTRLQLAGARPEALAHLALALATDEHPVLFVSPHEGLLHERHHKFSRRVQSRVVAAPALDAASADVGAAPPGISWCSTATLAALVAKAGSWPSALRGYALIVVEAAEGLEAGANGFSPLLVRLGRALENELSEVPLLLGSAYEAKLPAVRIEESLPTSAVIVREAHGLNLAAELERLPRPLLALCSTPAEVDAVFAELSAGQVPVHRYHRGMSRAERARELVRFALPGRRAILVATSGLGQAAALEEPGSLPLDFGRGYARGDVRSIVHLSVPLTLSEYAAELGLLHAGPRLTLDAGAHDDEPCQDGGARDGSARDGSGSNADADDEPTFDRAGSESDDDSEDTPERVAVLFVDRAERSRALDLLARRRTEPSVLLGAHAALVAGPLDLDDLARRLHHSPSATRAALRVLIEAGLVAESKVGESKVDKSRVAASGTTYRLLDARTEALDPWLELTADHGGADRTHADLAWAFALGTSCRTEALTSALGVPRAGSCRCDICTRAAAPERRSTDVQTLLGVRPRATPLPRQLVPQQLVPQQQSAAPAASASRIGHGLRGPGVIRAVSRARA